MSKDLIPGGIIAWQDPPPPMRPPTGERIFNWQLMAYQLKANPGEWGLLAIGKKVNMHQSRISTGGTRWWMPAGSFIARIHSRPDGQKELYAKYVGSPEPVAT